MSKGVYIHVPFCLKKCLYCDFVSYVCDEHSRYFDCLMKEADMYEDVLSVDKADSIFIGGGTPTSVKEKYITGILNKIKRQENCEITIEANPGTVTYEKLKAYRDSGINRISIGLQSANDDELKKLGRIHNYNEFLYAYEKAVDVGFSNINVDIMFGIPGQSVESFRNTLSKVTELSPSHISCYSLIVEEGTPFYDMELDLPDEESERKMYSLMLNNSCGYERYEISNFCKKGYECRHNIKYWQFEDFIGLGAGAYSFINGERFSNHSNLHDYIRNIEKGELPVAEREKESREELIKDYIITALRMTKGISFSDFFEKFGKSFEDTYTELINKYTGTGHFIKGDNSLSFSDKGFEVSNYILSDFI